MHADIPKKTATKRAKAAAPGDITTMRVRRSTLATLTRRQQDLGASSLDEALSTILFRQQSYEAIIRLNADPQALADYRAEAREWAETDVEIHE
jgi:hypothetical protein